MEEKERLSQIRKTLFADRRWSEYADVLEQEIVVTPERDDRLELYEELGAVCIEHLRDAPRALKAYQTVIDLHDSWGADQALEVYQQLLELDPAFDEALKAAEGLLRSRGDENSLRHLAAMLIDAASARSGSPGQFLQFQRQAAEVFERDLGQPEAALAVLCASLNQDTWQTGILDDVERLAHDTGAWREPVAKVSEITRGLADTSAAARLRKRLGFWMLTTGDVDGATENLRQALRHHPEDPDIRRALDRIYRQLGRWQPLVDAERERRIAAVDGVQADELRRRFLELLAQAAAQAEDAPTRARFLAEAGTIHHRELGDLRGALRLWEDALRADETNIEACGALVDAYVEDERWDRAAPMLEAIIKAAEATRGLLTDDELNRRYLQYGRLCDMLGNEKLALHAYREAYELDRDNPWTLQRLGQLLYLAGEDDQAYHTFVLLMDRHERKVAPEVLLEVFVKGAEIKLKQKDAKTAAGLLDRAIRIDPKHKPALRGFVEAFELMGDANRAAAARQRLVEAEDDPTKRFAELLRAAEKHVEDGRFDAAVSAYRAALEIDETSVSVLRKLLEVFKTMGRWDEAVGVLQLLAEQEPNPQKSAGLYYAMGIIARDQLRNPSRAVGYLDRALDDDPDLLKALEAIDRLLTEQRAWKDLERAYRKMLRRVSENPTGLDTPRVEAINHKLFMALGEVYRSRLGHPKSAIEAFEAAQALRPDDEAIGLILAELYALSGERSDAAVQQYRKMLASDPLREDALHALYSGYRQQKRFDAAFCIAGALAFMNKSDEDETDYYRTYLGWNLKVTKVTFYPELLDHVYPRSQNRVVNAVMGLLSIALAEHYAHAIRDFGVNPKNDRIDVDSSKLVFAQMFRYVTKTMALTPAPHLFLRRDHPLGLRILNVVPSGVLIGSDMLEDRADDRDLVFRLAKLIAWLRPEHYLAAIGNGPPQLEAIFLSALDWALGRKPSAGRDGAAIVKQIKASPPQIQLQLQSLLRTYLERKAEPPDMGAWLTDAEHATSRFGLILCNDIQKAAAGIKREPQAMTLATVEERVRDLVAYSVSESYFEIRKELGLAIA